HQEGECSVKVTPRAARRLQREKKTHMQDMTEDEMLDLALRLSKQEAKSATQREQVEDDDMRKAIAESLQVSCGQTPETSSKRDRSAAKSHQGRDTVTSNVRCKLSFPGKDGKDDGSTDDEVPFSRMNTSERFEDISPLPQMPDLSQGTLSQPSPPSPAHPSVPSAASQESQFSSPAKQEFSERSPEDKPSQSESQLQKSPVFLRECSVRLIQNLPCTNDSSLSVPSPDRSQNSPLPPKSPVFPKSDFKRCTNFTQDNLSDCTPDSSVCKPNDTFQETSSHKSRKDSPERLPDSRESQTSSHVSVPEADKQDAVMLQQLKDESSRETGVSTAPVPGRGQKLDASLPGDAKSLEEFTSHMVLHLSDDDDDDDDEDNDKIIPPSPVFPQGRGSCAGKPKLSPTQPCSSTPPEETTQDSLLTKSPHRAVSKSVQPNVARKSPECRLATPAKGNENGVVSYYWGVPFCPKGLSPDDYTRVILTQLEVYEKSLKEARRQLLRKADWGLPMIPCPVERPHGRRLKRHRAPQLLEEEEDEEDEAQDKEEKKKKEKWKEREEPQHCSEEEAENAQQETYVVVSSPETQEELGKSPLLFRQQEATTSAKPSSCRKLLSQDLSQETQIPSQPEDDVQNERFDVESAVCPETQMTEDNTPELMVTSPAQQAETDVMEVDEVTDPAAEADERMDQERPGEEQSWRESVPSQVECPMCTRFFPLNKIEVHAAYCNGAVESQDVVIEQNEQDSLSEASARRRRGRRAQMEDDVRFEKSEQREKCFLCSKFFTNKEYNHHVDQCLQQKTLGPKQWLGPPCCLRGSFAFYKSVSCKPESGGPVKVWRLGEFYCVRCGPQEPVCIAEITLLWEDQRQRHPLASCRLYYLPEDTPKGRTKEHGEDEVIGVSKKVVVRVDNLVKWTCSEPPEWKQNATKLGGLHVLKGSPCATDQPEVKAKDDVSGVQHRVKVLSYPQYCRFRSLQKRIQDRAGWSTPQDPHLLALGWIKMTLNNTRVLYCRDTFSHPSLGTNPSLTPEFGCLSVSLKGRPRKRRGRDGEGLDQQSLNHSESWGERAKENVMSNVETMAGSWLPHPEEKIFLDQLYLFMERRGSPICKVPNLGFKKIDLFLMYSVVNKLGGYEVVTSRRMWKAVYNELGGSPGSTSAATCTRRHYEKLILPYEQHIRGGNQQQLGKPKPPAASVTSIRKPVRGRLPSAPRKNGITGR
ncbi:AT-rich interactive domain-containing protein 5B-like, partial [Clarias magur]